MLFSQSFTASREAFNFMAKIKKTEASAIARADLGLGHSS